jgi:CDP-diacylglycerol--serine O-phosphatidyltransferase
MRFDLKKTLFILPNLITLCSIFCGFYAIVVCTTSNGSGETSAEDFYGAALLIVFAMFFDVLDGRVARMTKTQSAFGVQIDSLADVVSFGVAPAVLVYEWSLHSLGTGGAIAAFAFCACGAIRLARFNVLAMGASGAPKKPSKYILGLPIPGAAGILVSLIVANHTVEGQLASSPTLVLGVVIALSFFMVSTIKFRSFKDVKLNARTVSLVTLAVGSSVILALKIHLAFAICWLLLSYVAIGLVEMLLALTRRVVRQRRRDDDAEEQPAQIRRR